MGHCCSGHLKGARQIDRCAAVGHADQVIQHRKMWGNQTVWQSRLQYCAAKLFYGANLGDKVEEQEKTDVEAAVSALQEVLQGDDKTAIEEKTAALSEISGKLAERVYKEQAQSAAGGDAGGG